MKEQILTNRMRILLPVSLALGLILVTGISAVPVFASSSNGLTLSSASTAQNQLMGPNGRVKADVVVTFNPNTMTIAPGSTGSTGLAITNKETFPFIVTRCTATYKLSTATAWTKEGCKSGDFTVAAGGSITGSFLETISKHTSAGLYDFRIVYLGTINGVASKSHTGTFTVTVT